MRAGARRITSYNVCYTKLLRAFEQFFPQVEIAGPVLDLGCGPGDIGFRFAARFPECEVVGLDGAREMIALAQQRKAAEAVVGQRLNFISYNFV